MKKICLALLVFLILIQSPLAAARRRSHSEQADIFVNPIGLIFGYANLGYEHAFHYKQSWLVQGLFAGHGGLNTLGLGGAFRFWMGEESSTLRGWYLGPEVEILSLSYSYSYLGSNYSSSGFFFGAGGQGGYQWILDNDLVFNAGAALDFVGGSLSTTNGYAAPAFGGVGVGLMGSIGYAF